MNMLIFFNMKNRLSYIRIEFWKNVFKYSPSLFFDNFFYFLSRKNIGSWTLKLESISMVKTLRQFEKQDWKLNKISWIQLQNKALLKPIEKFIFGNHWEIHLKSVFVKNWNELFKKSRLWVIVDSNDKF